MVTMSPEEFRLIRDLINRTCGIFYAEDRLSLFAGKLAPRLQATGCRDYLSYYRLIRYDDDAELQLALDALANNETYFWREAAQLHAITSLACAAPVRPFRVLSAGCSSGEEVYTVAMMCREAGLDGQGVDIVGMDVSTAALRRAKHAVYTDNSFRGVEPTAAEKYLVRDGAHRRLDREVAEGVRFRRANLLLPDEVESCGTFDVVLCRNVLIYFDETNRQRAIANVSALVRPGGFLFLGHAESLYETASVFEMVRVGTAIGYRRPQRAVARDGRRDVSVTA
jgi:chemotaxis protein methyltransferase CheR